MTSASININSNRPLLSIVIATYNRSELTLRALNSIQSQKIDRIEVIVIDDKSTDDSFQHISDFFSKSELKHQLHRNEKNLGRGGALPVGIVAATGEYCVILDSDDLFLDGALDVIIRQLEALDSKGGIIGVVWHCKDQYDNRIGASFEGIPSPISLGQLKFKYGVKGDKKEIVLTDVLKQSLVVPVKGERRVATLNYWIKASKYGVVLLANEAVAQKEYYADGMTANLRKMRITSPNGSGGCYWRALALPLKDHSIRSILRTGCNAWRFWFHGCCIPREQNAVVTLRTTTVLILCFFPGLVLFAIDLKK